MALPITRNPQRSPTRPRFRPALPALALLALGLFACSDQEMASPDKAQKPLLVLRGSLGSEYGIEEVKTWKNPQVGLLLFRKDKDSLTGGLAPARVQPGADRIRFSADLVDLPADSLLTPVTLPDGKKSEAAQGILALFDDRNKDGRPDTLLGLALENGWMFYAGDEALLGAMREFYAKNRSLPGFLNRDGKDSAFFPAMSRALQAARPGYNLFNFDFENPAFTRDAEVTFRRLDAEETGPLLLAFALFIQIMGGPLYHFQPIDTTWGLGDSTEGPVGTRTFAKLESYTVPKTRDTLVIYNATGIEKVTVRRDTSSGCTNRGERIECPGSGRTFSLQVSAAFPQGEAGTRGEYEMQLEDSVETQGQFRYRWITKPAATLDLQWKNAADAKALVGAESEIIIIQEFPFKPFIKVVKAP